MYVTTIYPKWDILVRVSLFASWLLLGTILHVLPPFFSVLHAISVPIRFSWAGVLCCRELVHLRGESRLLAGGQNDCLTHSSELGCLHSLKLLLQGSRSRPRSLLMLGWKPVGANHWDPSRSKHRQVAKVNKCGTNVNNWCNSTKNTT